HLVQRLQDKHCSRRGRFAAGPDRISPDLALQGSSISLARCRGRRVPAEVLVIAQPRIEIFSEIVPQLWLGSSRQQVEPEIRGANGVGLLPDQLPPGVKTAGRSRERKCDHQTHQTKDGSISYAKPHSVLAVFVCAGDADQAADLEKREDRSRQAKYDE